MHPLVRDLYRRLLWVGRDYPKGLPFVRCKAKEGFRANAALTEERELLTAVHRGRWWVKELEGVVQLRKYRAMRRVYGGGPGDTAEDRLERSLAAEQRQQQQQQQQQARSSSGGGA